jgi:uncharacterized protein YndB with AHSA1/START domain
MSSHEEAFEVTRVFNAPRELVFKAFTESERLAHWWGPKGFTMQVSTLDLRPGGLFRYKMKSPEGFEMWGRFAYQEIVAPERIVFVTSFSDEAGDITRHPMSDSWPLEVLNTMTLTEEEGKTRLTVRGYPINANKTEVRTFHEGHRSMEQGFKGTLDQLESYLAEAQEGA